MRSSAAANLLAMPPSLRTIILQETVRSANLQHQYISTTSHLEYTPQTRQTPPSDSLTPTPLSFLPSPSNRPDQTATPAPPPAPSSLAAATDILTLPPQPPFRRRFLFAAPRFLNLPPNTRVPEVCLLGRSNAGKSTLVNALAGAGTASAGRCHGPNARRGAGGGQGGAITSSKAGSTKTMNAFGFGPAPAPGSVVMRPVEPEAEVNGKSEGSGRSTRSERRGPKKVPEPPPRHSLVLMDMPGYGLNSKAEWGTEIAKYLGRRAMLRGAVLLVDAVAGLKNGDRMVLKMLRDADVRTAVVLTKADKLGYGSGDHGERAVKKMCLNVWQELRDMERGSMTWLEGKGWEREIWVTGAGDPKNGGVGVEGARLAICRMAGLVEDNRVFDVSELNPIGKIVPFDQVQWAAPSSAPRVDGGRLLGRPNRASF